jgi:hypothetical protein
MVTQKGIEIADFVKIHAYGVLVISISIYAHQPKTVGFKLTHPKLAVRSLVDVNSRVVDIRPTVIVVTCAPSSLQLARSPWGYICDLMRPFCPSSSPV